MPVRCFNLNENFVVFTLSQDNRTLVHSPPSVWLLTVLQLNLSGFQVIPLPMAAEGAQLAPAPSLGPQRGRCWEVRPRWRFPQPSPTTVGFGPSDIRDTSQSLCPLQKSWGRTGHILTARHSLTRQVSADVAIRKPRSPLCPPVRPAPWVPSGPSPNTLPATRPGCRYQPGSSGAQSGWGSLLLPFSLPSHSGLGSYLLWGLSWELQDV